LTSIVIASAEARPGDYDDAGAPRALMTCERADGPGRVRCDAEAAVPPGVVITWGDVVLARMPSFASPLRGRIGPGEAVVRRPDSWRWALAFVARARGAGDVEARVRLVVCSSPAAAPPDGGAPVYDRCTPYEVPVTAHVVVGE
jgi:hypothetical protein